MNIPTFPIVILTPRNKILTNTISYRPWFLLWLFTININRELLIWYTVSDRGELEVNFKKNKGYINFPSKEHAERWFGVDIEISEHVGETIGVKNIQLTHMVRCNNCNYTLKSEDVAITVEGPDTSISRYRHKPPHYDGVCKQCGSDDMVSIMIPR